HEERGPRNPHREKRRYHRRMQSPVGSGDVLSKETSEEGDEVYTGYFGANDIYHTFTDAIKGLKKEFPAAAKLFHAIDKEEDEGTIDREKARKEEMKEHKAALFNDGYEDLMLSAGMFGKTVDQRAYDAVHRACEMDRNLWNKYPKVDLGISGFVITLLTL